MRFLNRGRNRIVVTVLSEKVRDQLNTINSKEFDNRFHAQSIQRIVKVKSQGVIKDGHFSVTSSVVPMVGNVLVSASSDDIAAIFSRGVNKAGSVAIGRSIMENQPIRIPINDFFASHIGIFGNTGSGKSNTLHKLYLELFNSPYGKAALEKSSFVVIVNICSFQGHCYCRRRPIALFDDYCGSRPPLLRIKATGC